MVVCGGDGDGCTDYGICMVALMELWMAVVMTCWGYNGCCCYAVFVWSWG